MNKSINLNPESGQALAEFVVGLIALLVLAACLRIGSSMITAHSDAMTTARNEAAAASALDANTLSDAKYIHDVTAGRDAAWFASHNIPVKGQYTKDDESTTAAGSEFSDLIVNKTATADSDWDIMNQVPNNRIPPLRGGGNPSASFGLVKGSDKRSIAIDQVPAIRLFYNTRTLEVECNVWMTQLNGIY
jgi:hypothetical protein